MTRTDVLRGLVVGSLLVVLAGGLLPLQAQSDLRVRVVPRFGLISPDTYFYEVFANFADDDPTEWTNGSLGRSALVGLAVELGREDQGVFLRGELARSFGGWLSAVHGVVRPRVLFDPPEIVNTWLDVPSTLTLANLQLILPTQLEFAGIRPFLLAGGGGKWYHFGDPRQENTVEAILPSGGFTAALDLGVGAFFSVLGLAFDAQVRDSINKYWDKTQHDLIFSAGLRWPLR
jgi:hypothetical protein